jgi:hypothetical protein
LGFPGVLRGMDGSWFVLCEGVTDGSLMLLFAGFADLLNKDFHTDQKFTLTTYTSSGAVSISGFFTPSAVSRATFCMLRLLEWLLFLWFLVLFRCGMLCGFAYPYVQIGSVCVPGIAR